MQSCGDVDEVVWRRRRKVRRPTFGSSAVVALGIGALAVIVWRTRRRRTASSEHVGDEAQVVEAETSQAASQAEQGERTEQQRGEKPGEILAQNNEETEESTRQQVERATKGAARLRALRGQPMMSVIRAAADRNRGRA